MIDGHITVVDPEVKAGESRRQRGGVLGGGVLLPTRKGAVSPPQKMFGLLSGK